MPSRRRFLSVSAGALASAAMPHTLFASRLGGPVFSSASLGPYAQGSLTQAAFQKVLNSTFTVFLENDQVAYLRLKSVTGAPTTASPTKLLPLAQSRLAAAAPRVTQFSLSFAVTGPSFPQDTYLVDHGTLGRFSIFLVPSGSSPSQTCTAVFNYVATSPLPTPLPVPSPRQLVPLGITRN